MKAMIAAVLLLVPAPGMARAEMTEAFYQQAINAAACSRSAPDRVGACISDQIAACRDQLMIEQGDAGYMLSHGCAHEAFAQADRLLNSFWKTAIAGTKRVEAGFAGTSYQGQEALLRKLELRDTTCELNVAYGALMSGSSAVTAECQARLTLQRINDLEIEIGHYLD